MFYGLSLEGFAKWIVLWFPERYFVNACWKRAINWWEIYWVIWGTLLGGCSNSISSKYQLTLLLQDTSQMIINRFNINY